MDNRAKTQHIVIAGAGPMGLYVAIKLKELIVLLNIDAEIHVIDAKAGDYKRHGLIAEQVLTKVNEELGTKIALFNPTSNSIHIKDLEQAMYGIAIQKGVIFHKKHFESFVSNGVVLSDHTTLLCDWTIDCTGGWRLLVKAVNELDNSHPFTITRVDENPIKKHFIAQVSMDEYNIHLSAKDNDDVIQRILSLEALRKTYAWSEFKNPYIYSAKWTTKTETNAVKHTACYYFEIPEALSRAPREIQINYLKALLKLKSGNSIDFQASEEKLKFRAFPVDPYQVEEVVYKGFDRANNKITPMVFVCGDAQIDPDYRLGHGVLSGIKRANIFINALFKNINNQLECDLGVYGFHLKGPLFEHRAVVSDLYKGIRNTFYGEGLSNAEKEYAKALNNINQSIVFYEQTIHMTPESDVDQIIQAINAANENKKIILLGMRDLYCKQLTCLFPKKESIAEINFHLMKSICQKINEVNLELNALMIENIPFYNKTILSMAENSKQLANTDFSSKKFDEALKLYDISLIIYESLFSQQKMDEIIKIKSNKILIYVHQKKDQDIIQLSTEIFKIMYVENNFNKDIVIIFAKTWCRHYDTVLKLYGSNINERGLNRELYQTGKIIEDHLKRFDLDSVASIAVTLFLEKFAEYNKKIHSDANSSDNALTQNIHVTFKAQKEASSNSSSQDYQKNQTINKKRN